MASLLTSLEAEPVFQAASRRYCDKYPETRKLTSERLLRWMSAEAERRTRAGDYCVLVHFSLFYLIEEDTELAEDQRIEALWHRLEMPLWRTYFAANLAQLTSRHRYGPTGSTASFLETHFRAHVLFPGPTDFESRGLDLPVDRAILGAAAHLLDSFRNKGQTIQYVPAQLFDPYGYRPVHYSIYDPLQIEYPSEESLAAWHEAQGIVWL